MGRIHIVTSTNPAMLEELAEIAATSSTVKSLQRPLLHQLENVTTTLNVTTAHREARERAKILPGLTFYVLRLETLAAHPGANVRNATTPRLNKTTKRIRKIT